MRQRTVDTSFICVSIGENGHPSGFQPNSRQENIMHGCTFIINPLNVALLNTIAQATACGNTNAVNPPNGDALRLLFGICLSLVSTSGCDLICAQATYLGSKGKLQHPGDLSVAMRVGPGRLAQHHQAAVVDIDSEILGLEPRQLKCRCRNVSF